MPARVPAAYALLLLLLLAVAPAARSAGPSASTGGATVIGFNGQKVKLPKGAQLLFADGDGQAVTALVGEGQGRGNTAVKAMGFAFAQGGPVNATLRKGAGGKPWGAVVKVAGAVLPSGAQTTLGGGTTVKALAGGAGVVISTPTLRVTAFTRPQGKPQTGAFFNIGVTLLQPPQPPLSGWLGATATPKA